MFINNTEQVINKMNSTNLKSFKITGLFGQHTISLTFDKEVNIFIGENGLGKTTILNCLYYILEKKYSQLENVNFETIEIGFKNTEKIYSISKADILAYNQKRNRRRAHFDEDYLEYLFLEFDISAEDLPYLSNEAMESLAIKLSHLQGIPLPMAKRRLYNYFETYKEITSSGQKRGNERNIHTLSKAINEYIPERIIYLPTYRRIENDFRDLNIRKNEINTSEMLIRFGMSDVQMSIESILSKIRFLAMQGYNAMTSILLKQYTEGDNIVVSENYIIDLDIVTIILDRLGDQIDKVTRDKIDELIKTHKIIDPKYLHLLNLLHELITNYDLQKLYDDRIKGFVNTCNKYLNDKYFYYNPSNLTLDIYLDSNKENPQTVELTQLSSGEKQIVSLFSKLYLERADKSIVIIDEPELSLSITWQEMLLPDIMRSQNCNLLLTVTHSPFIFENEFDLDAKEIRAYIQKY